MINNAYLNRVFADLQKNHPNEPEFLQAVDEVFESLQYVVDKHPEWEEAGLMERFVEPERIIIFRVPWVDDNGKVQVNRGYRVRSAPTRAVCASIPRSTCPSSSSLASSRS